MRRMLDLQVFHEARPQDVSLVVPIRNLLCEMERRRGPCNLWNLQTAVRDILLNRAMRLQNEHLEGRVVDYDKIVEADLDIFEINH